MNKSLLQDDKSVIFSNVPNKFTVMFLKCGFTNLPDHQSSEHFQGVIDTKEGYTWMAWSKNSPISQTLAQAVNRLSKKLCKHRNVRFSEETV
jgi:hypothetical protein